MLERNFFPAREAKAAENPFEYSLVFAQATLDFEFSVEYGICIKITCNFHVCGAAGAASWDI